MEFRYLHSIAPIILICESANPFPMTVVTIGLTPPSATVPEDDSTVEFCAQVTGDVELRRSVQVTLSTQPGTATGNTSHSFCLLIFLTYSSSLLESYKVLEFQSCIVFDTYSEFVFF